MPSFLNKLALRFASASDKSWLHNAIMKTSLQRELVDLSKAGYSLECFYDIGAHEGHWSLEMQRVFPNAHFEMFEANPSKENFLKQTGLSFHLGPLSKEKTEVFFYAKGSTGDSVYQENSATFQGVEPVSLQAQRLDDVVEGAQLRAPDVIKLDTQGSELDIIAGGSKAFEAAKVVHTECPVVAYNLGAPTFDMYISALSEAGFLPHRICEVHDRKGVLVQIDILFLKRQILFDLYPRAKAAFSNRL